MAPQRPRAAIEDSRSEASSTKDRHFMPLSTLPGNKMRRNHGLVPMDIQRSLKEVDPGTANTKQYPQELSSGLSWSKMDLFVLRSYIQAYRLSTPSAFASLSNEKTLSRPGIGQSSPTMVRHTGRHKVSKDHLALAVRKDFNAAMIHEPEAITTFLYSVHNQDKCFRMRFAPLLPK